MINGGHYVAFVKNQTDQQWFCFNDSICQVDLIYSMCFCIHNFLSNLFQRVTEDEIEKCSSSAYLLFYERDSLDYQCYMPNIRGKQRINVDLPSNSDTSRCSIMWCFCTINLIFLWWTRAPYCIKILLPHLISVSWHVRFHVEREELTWTMFWHRLWDILICTQLWKAVVYTSTKRWLAIKVALNSCGFWWDNLYRWYGSIE